MNKTKLYIGIGFLIIGTLMIGGIAYSYATRDVEVDMSDPKRAAQRILDRMPIIDGHNDFPWRTRMHLFNDLEFNEFNFDSNLNATEPWASDVGSHTDLPRLRTGRVGAQFWAAYVSCAAQYKDAVEQTHEQIDVIKRLVKKYPDSLQFATSVADIEDAISNGRIASLIGVEGGHSIQSSFGNLRTQYELGVRYITMTHSCNTPWADAAQVDDGTLPVVSNGFSDFGKKIIDEMNRLGMMVDLSHVSAAAMKAALEHSKAPVIFSHSSAYARCNHVRNVQDDVLRMIRDTDSIIMVNFYSDFIQCDPSINATLQHVVEHIEHIRSITGPNHIGIGADYDGVSKTPVGLEDVSKYPDLFEALIRTGRWSADDLEKLSGRNFLRVFRDVEKVRDELQSTPPVQETMSRAEYLAKLGDLNCTTGPLPGDSTSARRKRGISDDFEEL